MIENKAIIRSLKILSFTILVLTSSLFYQISTQTNNLINFKNHINKKYDYVDVQIQKKQLVIKTNKNTVDILKYILSLNVKIKILVFNYKSLLIVAEPEGTYAKIIFQIPRKEIVEFKNKFHTYE